MLDIILGILAILTVIAILVIRESENKNIAYFGIVLILLIKLVAQ